MKEKKVGRVGNWKSRTQEEQNVGRAERGRAGGWKKRMELEKFGRRTIDKILQHIVTGKDKWTKL